MIRPSRSRLTSDAAPSGTGGGTHALGVGILHPSGPPAGPPQVFNKDNIDNFKF